MLYESAPPSKSAEDWVKANKEEFKKKYGDRWEEILYATAWKLYDKGSFNESADQANVTSSNIAMPDPMPFKTSTAFGHPCIEVDPDIYHKMVFGKQKYSRWSNYTENEELKTFIKQNYNKHDTLLLKNSKSGSMVYIKKS